MNRKIGRTGLQYGYTIKIWVIAVGSAALSFALKSGIKDLPPLLSGAIVLSVYGLIYFAGAAALGIPDARRIFDVLSRRLRS
jgi:hypothetical protein